jgi:hypothetical protein
MLSLLTEPCATCQALEQEIAVLRHELAAAGRDVAPVQSIDDNDRERELARSLSSTHQPDAAAGFRAGWRRLGRLPRRASATGNTCGGEASAKATACARGSVSYSGRFLASTTADECADWSSILVGRCLNCALRRVTETVLLEA